MSFECPVASSGRFDSREDAHLENAHLGLAHSRWRRDAPSTGRNTGSDRNTCVLIPEGGLRCVTWNTRGLIGHPSSPQLSWEKKHIYLKRLPGNNDFTCLEEFHGKDEFLQAIQVLVPQFRQYGTFTRNSLNAGGSAICNHKVSCLTEQW